LRRKKKHKRLLIQKSRNLFLKRQLSGVLI